MDPVTLIGIVVVALVVGLIVGWLLGHSGRAHLEAKARQMEESVNAQNAEIAKAYLQIKQQEQRINGLLASLEAGTAERQAVETQLAEAHETLEGLRRDLEAAVAERQELQAALEAIASERDQLRAQLAALAEADQANQAMQAELQGRLEAAAGVGQRLQAELDRKAAEAAELAARVATLERELAAATLAPAEVTPPQRFTAAEVAAEPAGEAVPSDVQAELEALRYTLSNLTAASAQLAQRLEEREQAYQALLAEVARASTRSVALGEATATGEQVAAAGETLSALRAELEEKSTALQRALTRATVVEAALREARAREQDLLDQLQAAEADRAELNELISRRDAEVDGLRSQVANLSADLEALASARSQLEEAVRAQDSELATVDQRLAALEADLRSLLAEVAAGEPLGEIEAAMRLSEEPMSGEGQAAPRGERLATLAAGLTHLASILRRKVQALENANSQMVALEDQLNGLAAERTSLELVLKEKESVVADLQSRLAQVTGELEAAQAARADLEGQLRAKLAEADSLRAQIEAAETELAGLVGRLGAHGPAETPGETVRFASVSEAAAALAAAVQEKDQALADARSRLAAVEARYAERGEWLEEFPAVLEIRQWLKDLPPLKQAAANAALRRGVLPHQVLKPQKLSKVLGIGKVFEQRLYDAGLGTYWEVANLSDAALQAELDLSDWQALNVDLDGIRTDALRLAEETGSVGAIWQGSREVDDLEVIEGLGAVYERRLYEAGLTRYEDIANASVEQLAAICRAPKIRPPDYAAWIEQAKALAAQKAASS